MSVDLYLLPFDYDAGEDLAFSHTVLSCVGRRDLWENIRCLPALPVPASFTSFLGCVPDGTNEGEYGYGVTTKTPYDEPLLFTTAQELLKVRKYPGVWDNAKNTAVWAYLAALPPSTKVALYWH